MIWINKRTSNQLITSLLFFKKIYNLGNRRRSYVSNKKKKEIMHAINFSIRRILELVFGESIQNLGSAIAHF